MRWVMVTTALALWACWLSGGVFADETPADNAAAQDTQATKAETPAPQAKPAADAEKEEKKEDQATAPAEAAKPAEKATAETKPAPAEQPAPQTEVATACTVKEVNRSVRWRPSNETQWQDMKVGDQLPLGADICTGLRATCRLEFNDASSVVDVQPMTIVRIGEFDTSGEKVRTRLYLKQGTVQADVEKARFQSDFAIVSPEVTLAVRGTTGIEFKQFQDTGAHCSLLKTGLLQAVNNTNGRQRKIRPGDKIASGTNMRPSIQNVLFKKLVPTYDLRGSTPQEIRSIVNKPQIFAGAPSGAAPGGNQNVGGFGRQQTVNNLRLRQFFQNNPQLLPGGTLPQAPQIPVRPRIIDDHGGSGM
ncbi:MAG: FecR domain-containing protein [Planctomycetes bacterium]|nr:FecR domain-containing protein [Planctomycetota bacterium]